MKDLKNPSNTLSQIIPSLFHDEFSREFLALTLREAASLMKNKQGKFLQELKRLETEVYYSLTLFLMDPCDGTDWCPPAEENMKRLQEILNRLK
jgi:hypothetical protein